MKPFNFEKKRSASTKETLHVGGYVCQIQGARIENYSNGFSSLILAIDVIEGDYKGIWKRDYDNNTNEDKKWRGTFRVNIPSDDGSEQDAWAKRRFGGVVWAIEESNPGYTWDWDEKKLKGKKIGIIYRNREWEMNGNTGWTTEAGGADSVENIREGKFKPLKDRPLKNKSTVSAANTATDYEDVSDPDSLPF